MKPAVTPRRTGSRPRDLLGGAGRAEGTGRKLWRKGTGTGTGRVCWWHNVFLPAVAAARRGRLRSRRRLSGPSPGANGGRRVSASSGSAGTRPGNGRGGESTSMKGQRRSHHFTHSGRCQSPHIPPSPHPHHGCDQDQCPHVPIPTPALPNSAFPFPHSHPHPYIPISPSPRPLAASSQATLGCLSRGHWQRGRSPAPRPCCLFTFTLCLGYFPSGSWQLHGPCSGCECKCLWVSQPGQGTHSWWPHRTPWPGLLADATLLCPTVSHQSSHGGRGTLPSSGFTPEQLIHPR